MLDSSPFL